MLELRVITPDDWPLWRELRLAALADAPGAFGSALADWQGDGDREERWRGRLAIPGSYNLVSLLDGIAVGMASGAPGEDAGAVELISMWVAPRARGQGVGDSLVGEVARWASVRRASRLRLWVAEGNPQAAALYLRNGFRYTGEDPQRMPDGVRLEVAMERPLAP
ncbi:MAG TPA: GNAT family N-acetyltransferase [Nocardioidaceae bacterium]|nr:GNAT family N-acetyltransferase [Nocardioidaceae bacterium]